MAVKKSITYRDVIESVRKKEYAPVYLLMGEESYYIDCISEYMEQNILKPVERDFNQQVIYCQKDDDNLVSNIINTAKKYPMMSDYQVLIVKEAQNLLKFDDLIYYVKNPVKTTILVICYKHSSIDKKKKILAAIEEVGMVFESQKIRESALPSFIVDYLRKRSVMIDNKACMMMAENVGNDLCRLSGELDKLIISLPDGRKQITAEDVEKNVGISKDFNMYELKSAIEAKDVYKANMILNYIIDNLTVKDCIYMVALLFSLFSNIMLMYYAPDKTKNGLMQQLNIRSDFQLTKMMDAQRNYSAMKAMLIISKIREADAMMKGVGKGNTSNGDILRELVYFILH